MKVLIIDENYNYVNRLTKALQQKYGDRYDIYTVTDNSNAIKTVSEVHPEIVIVDKDIVEVHSEIESLATAIFVADRNIEQIFGKRAICKYRSVDEIHQEILGLLADSNSKILFKTDQVSCNIWTFTSPAGGTGCSSLARACAANKARKGKRTLFLTLNPYENIEIWLQGVGKYGMSDLIYAIKSRSSNFGIKIESCLKKSKEGILFFGCCKNPLDMMELTADDKEFLLQELQNSGLFDEIVIDYPFEISKECFLLQGKSRAVFWINDGRTETAEKISRAYRALSILAEKEDVHKITGVVNNRFSDGKSYCYSIGIPEMGKILEINREIMSLRRLSEEKFFDMV